MMVGVLSAVLLQAVPSLALPSFDAKIAQMVDGASSDTILRHIRRLQDFKTRYALADSCRAAEQFLYDYLVSLGLDSVAYDTVQYQGVAMRNVVGTLRGSLDPDALILLCAHLDATSPTPMNCAPGAEDNGSGTAVVLETARLLKAYKPKYTIKFVLFTGEELDFLGSEHMAKAISATDIRISALLNLDMVAWPGGAFGVKILCDSGTHALALLDSASVRTYTTLDPQIVSRIPLPSDNYPFQTRHYPCLSHIERFEHDTDGYKWYHTCADTLAHVSIALAAQVAKATTAALMSLMDIPAPPTGVLPSPSGNDSGFTIHWNPNLEKNVAGYTLYWGAVTHAYTDSVYIETPVTAFALNSSTSSPTRFFALKAMDSLGNSSWFSSEKVLPTNSGIDGASRYRTGRQGYSVHPRADRIEIEFQLDAPRFVSISILDLKGRILKVLANGWQGQGSHIISWDGRDEYGTICRQRNVIFRFNHQAGLQVLIE